MALTQRQIGEDFRTIAIIGGGFSGVAVAIHLLGKTYPKPTRIALIERSPDVGRGAAYAVRDFPYLLNVPAGQMSLYREVPADFTHFALARGVTATGKDFLPRALYGEYLAARLATAVQKSAGRVTFIRVTGEAIHLEKLAGRRPDLARWNITLAEGRDLLANDVVLALGNPAPRQLPELAEIAGSAAYVHDPWSLPPQRLHAAVERERVLLIGAGLTMADIAIRLAHGERPPGRIDALSRHGIEHQRQTDFERCHPREEDRNRLARSQSSLRQFTRSVRALVEEVEARAEDWRSVVALVRAQLPIFWQRLGSKDRRRFLRHVRPHWDTVRHRLAPQIHAELERLRASGLIALNAGRLVHAEPLKRGVQVIWRARSGAQEHVTVYDRVINCTGPDFSLSMTREPLVRSLLRSGLIRADEFQIGLSTDGEYRPVNASGQCVDRLHYLGPCLRAQYWEATAVPELRAHAERLAELIATPMSSVQPAQRAAMI